MITRDDIVVTSVLHEGSQQYLITAKVTLQSQCSFPVSESWTDEVVLRLKDRVLYIIYGDIRRQLDKAEEKCWTVLTDTRSSFDGGFSQVMEAIQLVRDVLDGRQEDD